MKLAREKLLRSKFVKEHIDHIAGQMSRTILGEAKFKSGIKSYRNVCIFTGRSRGVYQAQGMSRLVYRNLSDQGKLEGVRRASW